LTVASEIELFQILKGKLGEKEAEAIVSFVDQKLKQSNDQNLKALATKEDLAKEDLANAKTDMIKWFFAFFIALA
jgi:hypothetical protein